MPIDAWPCAVVLVAGGLIVDLNVVAMRLLGAGDKAQVVGRQVAELIVVGDAVTVESDGLARPDGAGTVWRHGRARPVSGAALPVLVAQGDALESEGEGGGGRRCAMVVLPAGAGRDTAPDDDERSEARGRIAGVFANLAHEMRTPLNAVIGFAEIMQGEHLGPLDLRYKHYARDIVGAGYHLLALVNGALDLGRASAGPTSLDERPVELRAVLSSVVAMLDRDAKAKSITVDVGDVTTLPVIYADETRIRQLLVNLISNAVKYSPVGRPVRIRHRVDEAGNVWLDVVDAGVGMSRDEIAVALLPFGRTESALRTGEAGTGLGLPISKAIVEAHGGRLVIDSEPRRGTTVSVVLPADRLVAAPGHGGLLNLL